MCGNNTPWSRYSALRTMMPVHVRASAEQQRTKVLFVRLLQDYIQDTIAEWRRRDIDVLLCPVIGPAFNLLYCGKNSRTVHWTAGCVSCQQVFITGEIHWAQKAVYRMNPLRYQRQLSQPVYWHKKNVNRRYNNNWEQIIMVKIK